MDNVTDTDVKDAVGSVTDNVDVTNKGENVTQTNLFVETAVFHELKGKISRLPTPNYPWRAIFIYGPKGFGKSWSLKELCFIYKGYYVDLGNEFVDFGKIKSHDYLFLDNAQEFREETIPLKFCLPKYIIASFSPGVSQTGYKILRKRVGDGSYFKFYCRPFTLSEAEALVKKHHFKIVECEGENGASDYEKETISRRDFYYMYSVTNGNPRHIVSYLYCQYSFEVVKQDVAEQFHESQGKEVVAVVGSDAERIDKYILDFVLGKSCDDEFNVIVQLGLAYCTDSMGDGQFKISSLFYLKKAVENMHEFVCDEDWRRLEVITQLMILCGPCQATLDNKEYTIPRATKKIVQKEIGNLPMPGEVSEGVVTLLKLASGHNVVDFVLYDRRGTPMCVYFIQTSKSNYGIKKSKQKYKAALSKKVMSGKTEKSAVSIEKHYTASFEELDVRYVFATTDLCGSDNNPEVIFLSLLNVL